MLQDYNSRTIFVAIPTMEDYEYASTIQSLFMNAKYPERVFVGSPIYLVSMEQLEDPDYDKFWELNFDYPKDNYRSDFFLHKDFYGVGKGRLNALRYFNGEHYYFQVDSHMRFEKNWDVNIIDEYEECKEYFGDLVLYGRYAPHYEDKDVNVPFNNEYKLPIWVFDHTRAAIFPVGWDYSFNTLEDVRFIHKESLINNKYLPAVKHCAHNLFTESNPWVTQHAICLDPEIVFWGEEFYQATLAWMRGYEFCWSVSSQVAHKYSGTNDVDLSKDNNEYLTSKYTIVDGKAVRDYFGNVSDKKYKYEKYNNNKEILWREIEALEALPNFRDGSFGYVPRSFEGWLKWSGISMSERQTKDAFYLPPLNPVFRKSMKGEDTNAITP